MFTTHTKQLVIILITLALLLNGFAAPIASAATDPQIPPQANPHGASYGEWAARWWQWHYSLPASNHPAFSNDGADCALGQSGKVWFLAGAFTTESDSAEFATIERESCVIPTGTAIFFPIVNVECSTVAADEFFQREDPSQLSECATNFVDGTYAVITDLSVTLDGKAVADPYDYRAQSDVYTYNFSDPSDNIAGVDCSVRDCANIQSATDGYWIMLAPLSAGQHTLRFTGSFRDPSTGDLFFGLDVTYLLTVEGGK